MKLFWRNLCEHKIARAKADRSLAESDKQFYPNGSFHRSWLELFIAVCELKIEIWKALKGVSKDD